MLHSCFVINLSAPTTSRAAANFLAYHVKTKQEYSHVLQTSPASIKPVQLPRARCSKLSVCVKCDIRVSVAKHLSNLSPISLNRAKLPII